MGVEQELEKEVLRNILVYSFIVKVNALKIKYICELLNQELLNMLLKLKHQKIYLVKISAKY